MAMSQPYFTATVVYEHVWRIYETPKETSTYTTHYVNSPGSHTGYAIIANTALPSSAQLETIGITYSISAGELSTQHVLATVATSMPTSSIQHSTQTPWLTATGIAAHTPQLTKASCHTTSLSHGFPLLYETYSGYLQMLLLLLFLCGYLLLRPKKARRSQDDSLEQGGDRLRDLGQAFIDVKDSTITAKP
ncbi:hypothetical protein M438DRAFT_344920 [Aureobasidium pullulans EXF-150]|uniref:Uncharacterized protein n=1 Tax=Aureobasidium pullulans EXF-150 TaxID=1043002 RepID=A0A074XUN3_AURPU|nr:uncharacterized protein M438DRAFT_344920 [Aureobasidium pullulans EXF-150]KEQ85632.1 hypothetical protein M438DRAFT_344920 [Aureobasidium pullulans EXF-150]